MKYVDWLFYMATMGLCFIMGASLICDIVPTHFWWEECADLLILSAIALYSWLGALGVLSPPQSEA